MTRAQSVILNSPLRVALAVTPVLAILSLILARAPLTLPPLLVVALFQAALLGAVIAFEASRTGWRESCSSGSM